MDAKIPSKRALNELLHICGLWRDYLNLISSSHVGDIAEFDRRFALEVGKEIRRVGIECGDSAQLNSNLRKLFSDVASKMQDRGITVTPGIKCGLKMFPKVMQFHSDRMLILVNFSSHLDKAGWCGLLDKHKHYLRGKVYYSTELLSAVLYSALSKMTTSRL